LANHSQSDLFLGLYCNASIDHEIHGTTTYFYHPQSYRFARFLEDEVAHSLGLADNGVMKDNLYVIKNTTPTIPDVLIEYAYISNRSEEHLLSSRSFRSRIAVALANAITGYFLSSSSEKEGSGTAQITSVSSGDGELRIASLGRPSLSHFSMAQDGTDYFVLTMNTSVLEGAARTIDIGPPMSGEATVAQYSVNPDIVRIVIREDYRNTYRTDTRSDGGSRFLTTIFPTED